MMFQLGICCFSKIDEIKFLPFLSIKFQNTTKKIKYFRDRFSTNNANSYSRHFQPLGCTIFFYFVIKEFESLSNEFSQNIVSTQINQLFHRIDVISFVSEMKNVKDVSLNEGMLLLFFSFSRFSFLVAL